ncbi:hypothetical protein SPBR_01012 [Sporothrix brasiliensis 5110]|uniref:Ribosome biogenesis protein SLX9 n=1 Tax=Sporothrix brasiliensis 5110 TaxID=1398154 RepID=A0A0C2IPI3_9PEZI|nr:uncharacterized protein SPBR_01012 [Sporothrix brasiliensis 5110]KIH90941.1 hypothetical protein SPBR_01012 [Sporothrix brasiliensis 5110]
MSHRAKALARIADPTLPRKVHRDDNTVTDAFLHSKRDKQLIRKATFRARVLDKAGPTTKPLKRRRPSKKLVATLESLADSLPEIPSKTDAAAENAEYADDGEEWDGIKRRRRQQSLKTRPGSLKRKAKVVQAEIARFGQNLAQLTAVKEDVVQSTDGAAMDVEDKEKDKDKGKDEDAEAERGPTTDAPPTARQSTANRFALLRNYITMTMEQNPAFAKQG